MHEHLVHALADLRELVVLHEVCGRSLVRGRPTLAAVVTPEDARGGDSNVEAPSVGGIELDRVQAGAAEAWLPAVARRMLEQGAVRLPRRAAVVGAEEHVRIAARPERGRLRRMPGLDVPHALQRLLSIGHRQLLGALPRLAEVVRALNCRAVDEVVRRDVEGAVPRIHRRVEDLPALQQRPLDFPLAAGLSPRSTKSPLRVPMGRRTDTEENLTDADTE